MLTEHNFRIGGPAKLGRRTKNLVFLNSSQRDESNDIVFKTFGPS